MVPTPTALKDDPMMINNTLAQLRELKLAGMASAVEEQLSSSASTTLCFEERLALMVDREVNQRSDKRRAALLKKDYKIVLPGKTERLQSLIPDIHRSQPTAITLSLLVAARKFVQRTFPDCR